MKICDVMDFCDLVLSQYGNLDVVIFAELAERSDFTLNEVFLDLLEIPVSRLSEKSRLVLGMGFGRDIHFNEDQLLKESKVKKSHLRLVK